MSFTTDVTTSIGKVRVLLWDRDEANPIFQDDVIEYLLSEEGNSIKRAAALGYELIAGNQAFVLKVIKLLQLSTNGQATAQALLAVAQRYRDQALLDEHAAGGTFDYAEQVLDEFSARQRLLNQIERISA